jgi:hypothetical protein
MSWARYGALSIPWKALVLLCLTASAAAAQPTTIGIIDVYGLRTVPEQRVREALGIREGDPMPSRSALMSRLAAVPGVTRAEITTVCCADGKTILFVGVAESAEAAGPRAMVRGTRRPAEDVLRTAAALDAARTAAIVRGDAGEDVTQGHSLMNDSTGRALQQRFVGFAERDLDNLRLVLREAGESNHRAVAAQVLAYHKDKQEVLPDLVAAMTDPSPAVRNEAMRALAIIAPYAGQHPELGIDVPSAPFVELLGSLVWTDRNKASMALMQLTATRDPQLLGELRARALPALVEMARWKSEGHALPAFVVLGRMAGMTEEAIQRAWSRGDRQSVISGAASGARRPSP